MKNLCLALTLCLCLTACGGERVPAEPTQSPQPSPEITLSGSEPAQVEPLTSPPELMVSTLYKADHVTAECGNFSWKSEVSDGQWHNIIACGASPLDEMWEKPLLYTAFPAGTFPPLEEGELLSSIMPVYYLDFGLVPPDTVTVRRWSADYIGQDDAWDRAEEVSVEWTEDSRGRVPYGMEGLYEVAFGCYALYPLGDGEFVYEVHAVWDDFGTADYVFQTIPQVRGEG